MTAEEGFTERRQPTAIGSTEGIPVGTLVTVPTAAPSGSAALGPVVAVSTTHWYQDSGFMLAAGGAVIAVGDPIAQALIQKGPIDWRTVSAGVLLGLIAWIRNRTNTVVK